MPEWTCKSDLEGHRFYFSLFFIEVQLIYNVGLISAVQPSDSVVYIHVCVCVCVCVCVYPFKTLFPTVVYYKILNIVPCAIQ